MSSDEAGSGLAPVRGPMVAKSPPDCRFTCALDAATAPLPHVWEHTVGSCHATLALQADWQRQLTRCRHALGFRHVRFHGLLSDDMGTLVREDDALVYSFFNADQIVDFLLSIDMRPFVELSFMPTALASKDDVVFHYGRQRAALRPTLFRRTIIPRTRLANPATTPCHSLRRAGEASFVTSRRKRGRRRPLCQRRCSRSRCHRKEPRS